MIMTQFIRTAFIAAAMSFAAATANAQLSTSAGTLQCGKSIYGAWVTHEGTTVINIRDCENAEICGELVKFSGDAEYNDQNPAPVTASRDSGPRILSEFRAKSDNKFKGRIFNPRNGKTYKSSIKVSKMGDLKVKGCIGPICETKIWSRPKVCQY